MVMIRSKAKFHNANSNKQHDSQAQPYQGTAHALLENVGDEGSKDKDS